MTDLTALLRRALPPAPWAEGETIPWNEPDFSRRMLREHLSQDHDAASRRFATIDSHVAWLSGLLPLDRPARILDLACGPGLYAIRFAAQGHSVTGIDFSPASIAYAREQAAQAGLQIRYELEDLRQADFGSGYDLAMLIYGEFNVFQPGDARLLLEKARAALRPGGQLILEPHPFGAVQRLGQEPHTWYTSESGLFSDEPYLCLKENFWDARLASATNRIFIVDLQSGGVVQHSASMQAYSDDQYRDLLAASGFGEIDFCPSLTGGEASAQADLFVIRAW